MRKDDFTSRHLVYNANGFTLEVRIDSDGDGEVRLGGQLVQRQGVPMPEVPVFLVAGSRLVSSSMTGPIGQFHLASDSKERLRLCLSLDENELIEVDLARTEKRPNGRREPAFVDSLFGAGHAEPAGVRTGAALGQPVLAAKERER